MHLWEETWKKLVPWVGPLQAEILSLSSKYLSQTESARCYDIKHSHPHTQGLLPFLVPAASGGCCPRQLESLGMLL